MVNPGMQNMQMLNFNNILNVKDSRWLQLEVCREFQRNKCSRPDTECKFAHPPVNVEVQNGRVTACYDSIKGRCNREKPPCKYFHPPQHLKDQLLINGRNHLALKNAFMTQIQGLSPNTQLVHGTLPVQQTSPYLAGIPTMANFNPYISSPVMTVGMTEAVGSPLTGVVPQQVVPAQKLHRTDRLEVCREFQRGACKRCESECRFAHPPDHVGTTDDGTVTVCMDAVKGRCARDPCRYFHPPPHLQAQLRVAQARPAHQPLPGAAVAAAAATAVPLASPPQLPAAAAAAAAAELGKKRGRDTSDELIMVPPPRMFSGARPPIPVAFPGMGIPYKRPAPDKTGVPVYQPTGNAAYQQALMQQLGGQSYVPVSCEYGGSNTTTNLLALPPPNADASTHSPPITHNAALSSAQLETPSSSSSTYPSTYPAPSSYPTPSSYTTSSSTTTAGKASAIYSVSSATSSLPSNVLSYTGYAINKGHTPRPATVKVSTTPSYLATQTSAVQAVAPTAYSPGMVSAGALPTGMPGTLTIPTSLPNFSYGMGMPMAGGMGIQTMAGGMGIQMPGGMPLMAAPTQANLGMGGLGPAGLGPAGLTMAQAMGGMGAGMPPMFPQLIYPASSLFLPQLTALSNNPQYSWAQAGEQPYKKLKTS